MSTVAVGTTQVIVRDAAQNRADTCVVTVSALSGAPAYTLALNTSFLRLTQGENATLRLTVTPQQTGLTPVWSTSNANVADVTSSGKVIALGAGTAEIRVTLGAASAICIVAVSSQVTQPAVSNVTQNEAQLAFVKVANATYYLTHIYELRSGKLTPFLTLKVTPDGSVSLLRATAGNNLIVPLQYLSPGTSYVVQVEAVRVTGGKAEVIHTEVISFTTAGTATGLPSPEATVARVSYAAGTLYLEHLEGYACMLVDLQGQTLGSFRATGASERKYIRLKPGIYILTATDDYRQKVFKLAVSK